MQYVIDIPQGNDLKLILPLLERLGIAYKPVVLPKKEAKSNEISEPPAVAPAQRRSERYFGKLSAETADAMQLYVTESRNEWERI